MKLLHTLSPSALLLAAIAGLPVLAAAEHASAHPASPRVAMQSLDPAFFPDRVQFSWIENPRSTPTSAQAPRDFKESGTVRILNPGPRPLVIREATLDGPFVLANPSAVNGQTVAPGQSLEVTVRFARDQYQPPAENPASGVFTGKLQVRADGDAEAAVRSVALAGFWQAQDENNWEPNINEVWQVFGFANFIPDVPREYHGPNNPLNKDSLYEVCHPTEVLSPYWRIADGHQTAKITQIAAFHGPSGATVGIHAPGDKSAAAQIIFWSHRGDQNQTLLPLLEGPDGAFATRSFDRGTVPEAWAGDGTFGIVVAGFSSDPTLNPGGEKKPGEQQRGHLTRFFKALDQNGQVIPHVYLGIQDYSGINYDYNDNMFIIEGVEPAGAGR